MPIPEQSVFCTTKEHFLRPRKGEVETGQGGVLDLGFLPLSGLRLSHRAPCLTQGEGTTSTDSSQRLTVDQGDGQAEGRTGPRDDGPSENLNLGEDHVSLLGQAVGEVGWQSAK